MQNLVHRSRLAALITILALGSELLASGGCVCPSMPEGKIANGCHQAQTCCDGSGLQLTSTSCCPLSVSEISNTLVTPASDRGPVLAAPAAVIAVPRLPAARCATPMAPADSACLRPPLLVALRL